MPLPTPDQLTDALKAGQISQATFDQGMQAQLPPDMGDQGSAQAQAATVGPTTAPTPPAAPTPTAYDPSVVNALAGAGKYAGPGITNPNAGVASPVVQGQVSAAPAPPGATPPPVAPVAAMPPPTVGGAQPGQPGAPGQPAQGSPLDTTGMAEGLAQSTMTPNHQLGLSKTDKDFLGSAADRAKDLTDTINEANSRNAIVADNFQRQTDIATAQHQQGLADWQKAQADDQQARTALIQQARTRDSEINSKISELESRGIDPNHYWNSMSQGDYMSKKIGIFLGGLGGGENQALKSINGEIANDIDAQKGNMKNRLDLLLNREGQNDKTDNRELGYLNDKRDATLMGYNLVDKMIDKNMAAYKDNADVQTRGAQLKASLATEKEKAVEPILTQAYNIQKRGETVVQGSDPLLARLKRTTEIKAYLDKLDPNSPEAQKAKAELGKLQSEAQLDAAKANGGGPQNGRTLRLKADLNAASTAADTLDKLLAKGSSMSPDDRAQATAAAKELQNQGYEVPANPLEVWSMSGARRAGLGTVRQLIKSRQNTVQSGGGGEDNDPANLDESDK